MDDQHDIAERFLSLHRKGQPLLLANAWDVGAARLLAALGYEALATTSSGYAATLGRLDYSVSREEALAHAAALAAATELPVSADLENCFAEDSDGIAETVRGALDARLAGCSIEDWSPSGEGRLYALEAASERVRAAAQVAHGGKRRLVLTARAENHLRGVDDLADTIARLQAYEEAGADVLYAPGLREADEVRRVVESVRAPVNVLARPGLPSVHELAELGVARVSVGGSFAFAAYGAAAAAARELREQGTYGYSELVAQGARAAREAFAQARPQASST
jgi:2-methylisocitrate lyase-like PEP mutase family enzyme